MPTRKLLKIENLIQTMAGELSTIGEILSRTIVGLAG
jgi:hypothetical protein